MSPTKVSEFYKAESLPPLYPRSTRRVLMRGLALIILMAAQGAHAAVSDQNYDAEPVGALGTNSATLNGYNYTNNSSNAISIVDDGDIAGGSDHALGFRSNGANTSTQVSFGSSDGGEFKLNSFAVSVGFGQTNITIKGFRDNLEVASSTYDLSGTFAGTFDVSGDSNWENIDEVRITGSDLDIDIDDLDVSPAVVPSDSDGNLSSSGTVSEPVGLESTVDTAGEAVDIFDFTLSDGGTSDGLAMTVSEVVVNVSGTATDTVRDQITWRLNGNDASNVTGTYDAGADTITFSGLSISIADGGSETYTVNAYYNDNSGLTEDQTIVLSVDGDTDLTVGGSGTQMGATSAVNNGSGTTIDVTATGLAFTTQPAGSTSGSALSTQPVVAAQDAFGNTDVDFTETITLTEASAGSLSGDIDVAASAGVATFTDVTYTATADQQSFTLTADDQSGTGSDLPTADANSVTSDVVATQLSFDTQPSPTTIDSGIATNMTTVPVVSAVDANDVVDTGYSTSITLAEVNGAGSATMSGTGDTDGNGATVSITPSSGTSTFTGLQLTYTASGGSDETFNLQASSGGLTTADSNLFTAVVNQVPTDIGLNSTTINQSDTGSGSIIGALNTTDADSGDTHTYSIVGDGASGSGSCGTAGDDDNASFQVDNTNDEFETAGSLAAGSYSVCLQTSDGIASYQESFTITVADDVAPTVSSVSVPANDTYSTGQNLDFTVNANENITVNTSGGTPRIALTIGSTTEYAAYISGSGTSALVFRYTVQSGDEDTNGIAVSGLETNGGTLQDSATNDLNTALNSIGDTSSVQVDAVAPTGHSVSFDDEALGGAEASAASFTFASAEVGADYSYTINSSGGGTPVTGSGTVASAGEQISGIDVSGLSDGTLTLSVTLTDTAGNSASAVTDTASLDTTAPSGHSVSFDDGTLNGTEAGATSFTFASAEVGASYSYTISSTGGTPVTDSGTVASSGEQITGIDVSGLSDGTLTLSVTLTDAAGNSADAVTDTATLDATSPTTSLSTAASDPTNGAFDITVTFGETVSGFDVGDITATNASLSSFSGSGASYTATVTPTADGSVNVDVAAGVAQDAVGNGNTAASTLNLNYDGTAPTPTITSAEASPSNSNSFTATINFGEAVSGFAEGDISAGNATLGGFTDNGDGSFDVTVTPDTEGTITLDVNAGVAQDTAGNNNEAASQFSLEYDGSAPSLIGSSPADGATGVWFNTGIELTFSEAVIAQSGGVIEVFEADGTPVSSVSATSSDVSISGSAATIDIPDLEPTVSYYVQVSSGAFADSAGNIYGGIANDTELNFTVTNLAPSAGGDAAQIVEDQSADLGILNNDTDPEGDLNPASVQIVTPPAHGSTSIDTGSGAVTYTPDANFAGQDSFTYTVEDALGAVSNEATMTIGIININDAPMAGDDTANTPEDNPISIDVAADDTDIDDGDSVDPSTIVITAAPANGNAELVNGEVLYTPNTDFNGTDQFSYTIEDQNGGVSNAATVIVNVNGVNDTPTAADDSASVDEDNPVDVDVTANDSDIDGSVNATTVQVLDDVTNGTLSVDGTTGVVTYTPDENFNGTDTFTYVVQDDANGTSNEATVTLTVSSVNDAPVAEDNAATLQEETPHDVNVLGNDSDVDGTLDATSVEVVSAPSDGSTVIDTSTGAITYTPDENFDGNDSFTYRVMDNEGTWSNIATVNLTVEGVNDAPLANDDDATTEEDTSATIDLLTNDNDVDGTLDAASIALTSPTHGSVSLNGDGTATYTPDEHFNGADSFTYTVNDDVGEPSNSATVSVTVTPVNDAPTLSGTPAASVNEGEAYSFTPTAADVDANETLSFSITGQPAWAEFDNATGALTGTPGIADSGSYPGIMISVSDGDASTDLATFSIEVLDVNNAPSIGGTAPTMATVGQAYTFTPTADDPDESDTLTYSATGLPGWLSLNGNTGELTGTPTDDDVGNYTGLQISVSDGAESASLAAFDLTVEPGADSDGDSFSDYQENLDGTDPNDPASYLDLMPPQLAAPDERVLDAEALFTQITLRDLLGLEEEASDAELQDALDQLATDDIDGNACCNPRVEGMEGNRLRLAPGRHEITWLAEDFQNNSAEATQVVNIRPMVSLSKDQVAVAGNTVEFSVILSGESPFYPLTIPYRVSGDSTANGEDHDLTDGTVVLEAGEQRKTVEVTLAPNDGESRETLIVELDDRTGNDEDLADGYDMDNPNIYDINSGAKSRHRIAIVDGNVAPRVQLQLVQEEERRLLVPIDGGTATVTAQVTDPNAGDSHQYDWSASDTALVDTDGDSGNDTLVFEPQSLNPGRYRVAATVTDSAGEATSVSRHFVVVPVPPALNPGEDSDADGIDDATEGFADNNGNGIPNYQDSLANSDVLLESADQQNTFLMECDPGLTCGLGAYSLPTGNGGAQIGEETVGLTGAIPADASFEPVGGIFDFELADLPELGQSARIVIPQRSPIPARATYRKFQNGTWVTFVEDADNALHSAEGETGFCPPPGDDDWESGLVEGYHCVQLTIEDGGPNDADGEVNGSISDPGAVSQAVAPPAYDGEVTTRSSGGGGSTTGLFGALLLTLGLARRFIRRPAPGGRRKRRAFKALSWLPLLALAGLMLPGQQANAQWLNDMQFELGLYRAKSDVTPREFRAGMAKSGTPVTLSQYDVDRQAMSLEVGLPLTDYVQLDIGYLSLGEVNVDFEARGADPDALALGMRTSYPYSTSGWTIAPEIRIPLEGRMSLLVEAGLYRWGSETTTIGPNLPQQKQNGVDPLLGAGFELPVNERLDAGFTYRRVFFNDQSVDMMGVSLSWHY